MQRMWWFNGIWDTQSEPSSRGFSSARKRRLPHIWKRWTRYKTYLDQLSVQNKEQQPATLERAQNVIQLAMERLEEEFCHFLRRTVDMWIRISSLTPWQWLDHSEALSMTIIIIP
jgi:hypothetical protein